MDRHVYTGVEGVQRNGWALLCAMRIVCLLVVNIGISGAQKALHVSTESMLLSWKSEPSYL